MWELDYKEGWTLKNWCFWAVVLNKTLDSPLDCKEIQPVHPKGNQPWIFIGRTDAEVEALILWSPDAKSQLTGKDPDAGKDWGQEEKWATEDEMVGWHHQLNGHECEQTLGENEGQEAWYASVQEVTKSQTWLSDWTTTHTHTHTHTPHILFYPCIHGTRFLIQMIRAEDFEDKGKAVL